MLKGSYKRVNTTTFRDIVAGARTKISSAQLLQIIKAIKFDATNVFTSADLQNLLPILDQHLEFSDLLQALEYFGVMRAVTAKYLAFLNVLKQHLNPSKLLQVLAHQPATPKALATNPDQELQKFIFESLSQFVSTEHKQTDHKDSKDHSPTEFDKLIAAEDANHRSMLVALTLSPNKHDTVPLIRKMQPQDVYRSVTAVVWPLPAWIVIVGKLDKPQLTAVLQHPNYLSNYCGPNKTADDFRKIIAAVVSHKMSPAELIVIIKNCKLIEWAVQNNALAKVIPVLAEFLHPNELIEAITDAKAMSSILDNNDPTSLKSVYDALIKLDVTQETRDEKAPAPSIAASAAAPLRPNENIFNQALTAKSNAGKSALVVFAQKAHNVKPLLKKMRPASLVPCVKETAWDKDCWEIIVDRLEPPQLLTVCSQNNDLCFYNNFELFQNILTTARSKNKISSAELLQIILPMGPHNFGLKEPQTRLPFLIANLEVDDLFQAIEFFGVDPLALLNAKQFATIASHPNLQGNRLFTALSSHHGARLQLLYQHDREGFDNIIAIAAQKCSPEQMLQLTAPMVRQHFWQNLLMNIFISLLIVASLAMIASGISALAGFQLLFITSALTTHAFGAGVLGLLLAGGIKLFSFVMNRPVEVTPGKLDVPPEGMKPQAGQTTSATPATFPTLTPAQLAAKVSDVFPGGARENGSAGVPISVENGSAPGCHM